LSSSSSWPISFIYFKLVLSSKDTSLGTLPSELASWSKDKSKNAATFAKAFIDSSNYAVFTFEKLERCIPTKSDIRC
jgi:hypothetical protein